MLFLLAGLEYNAYVPGLVQPPRPATSMTRGADEVGCVNLVVQLINRPSVDGAGPETESLGDEETVNSEIDEIFVK